jgi:hypothetical protein
MTLPSFRAAEPMYIVILRDKNAEQQLRAWAKSANCQVVVDSNRMKIFEQRHLSNFQISWTGDWQLVTVWDCWNRRHIYYD